MEDNIRPILNIACKETDRIVTYLNVLNAIIFELVVFYVVPVECREQKRNSSITQTLFPFFESQKAHPLFSIAFPKGSNCNEQCDILFILRHLNGARNKRDFSFSLQNVDFSQP